VNINSGELKIVAIYCSIYSFNAQRFICAVWYTDVMLVLLQMNRFITDKNEVASCSPDERFVYSGFCFFSCVTKQILDSLKVISLS
jgi:hypothetical protein